MPAGKQDLFIEQGTTFKFSAQWLDSAGNPKDLTGYTARMQIRASQQAPTMADLSSPSSGITIDAPTGTVNVTITNAQTDAFSLSKALYDLEMTAPNGDVTRLLQGGVTVDPNITQAGTEAKIV